MPSWTAVTSQNATLFFFHFLLEFIIFIKIAEAGLIDNQRWNI